MLFPVGSQSGKVPQQDYPVEPSLDIKVKEVNTLSKLVSVKLEVSQGTGEVKGLTLTNFSLRVLMQEMLNTTCTRYTRKLPYQDFGKWKLGK